MKTVKPCLVLTIFLLLSARIYAAGLINNVTIDKTALTAQAKTVQVSWTSTEQGLVTVFICDLQRNIVKTFFTNEKKNPGTHTVTWDGTDGSGHACPAGIYVPVIRLKSSKKGTQTYNPTALKWGEEIFADTIEYDKANRVIRYTLNKKVYCRLRVGEKDGGPLYRTVSGWKLREPGTYEEPWDGLDITGTVKASEKEKLRLSLDAFTPPENAVILLETGQSRLEDFLKNTYKKFPIHPPNGGQVAFYPSLPNGLMPDMTIHISFGNAANKIKGTYRLKGRTAVQVELDKGLLYTNPAETFELMLFIDGLLVREDKIKHLPASMHLDTTQIESGNHILTINLRTSGDRAASSSMKISVEN